MVFLFSLINISFTSFFFLFWHYVESVIFWIISTIFIIFFSKILSFFVEKEDIERQKIDQEIKQSPLLWMVEYFKKWSYYIAFLFFYLSLYGIVYSLNLLYNFSNFSEIFHYITFIISVWVIGIFFFLLQKKHETISLIFRSNSIIFTIIYSFLFIVYRVYHIESSLFFIIDSILPIITLLSILLFDSFFREKKKNIYIFLLFYIAFIIGYYTVVIFPNLSLWYIFLGVITFLMIVYAFIFPLFYYFRAYKYTSRTIGVYMGYIISIAIVVSISFQSISLFYSFILITSLIYQYTIYKFFQNYIAYIIFLFICIFLYAKIFFIINSTSFFISLIFIFLLPYIFIGISYAFYRKLIKEVYILQFISITMSVIFIAYYFFSLGSVYDILALSVISFFESILIFINYVRLKK